MIAAPPELAGHKLPGGRYRISAAEVAELCRLAQGSAQGVHPAHATVVSLRSLGVSIGELCALCDFDLADGPFLGELSIDFHAPLETDVDYQVSATIEGLSRHPSRQLGTLDKLRFRVDVFRPTGEPVVEIQYLWILPRGERT